MNRFSEDSVLTENSFKLPRGKSQLIWPHRANKYSFLRLKMGWSGKGIMAEGYKDLG